MASARLRGGAKKQKVGDLEVHWMEGAPVEEAAVDSFRGRLKQFQLLANGWAMAGCYKPDGAAKDRDLYCHWQDSCSYVSALRSRVEALVDHYSEDSILEYLDTVEAKIRAEAIALARQRDCPVPWGKALRQALKERNEDWGEFKDLLRKHGCLFGCQPSWLRYHRSHELHNHY